MTKYILAAIALGGMVALPLTGCERANYEEGQVDRVVYRGANTIQDAGCQVGSWGAQGINKVSSTPLFAPSCPAPVVADPCR